MQSIKFLPAIAALTGSVAYAQRNPCSASTYTITDVAQATAIPCRTMEGSIEVSSELEGELRIEGPERIRGDLSITNASSLVTLSSSSLQTIDGSFQLLGLTTLQNLEMTDLTTIGTIEWITLPALTELRLGTAGITSADSVTISDTDIQSLDGFNLVSVDTLNINNNAQLSSYNTQLANVSTSLTISSNSDDLNITLANLVWGNTLIFNDASHIDLPSLEFVNTTLQFNNNSMTSFTAPNLTRIGDNDIVFINNVELSNISLPVLERVGGSVRIVNNTQLEEISIPELTSIGGAVEFGGNFTEVDLPALEEVRGAFTVLSTSDISEACENFDDMEGDQIRGEYRCESENEEANEGEDSDSNGGNGGSSNDDEDDDDAAGIIAVNMRTVVSVGLIGALVQLVL